MNPPLASLPIAVAVTVTVTVKVTVNVTVTVVRVPPKQIAHNWSSEAVTPVQSPESRPACRILWALPELA